MSTDLFTPRSYPVSPRDFGSTYSWSSSEASSRLAARLERSEYKRSRGKQRVKSNSSRNHSKRRETRGSKRKYIQQNSSATTRTKREQDGVTSVWEVYRQNPYQFDKEKPKYSTDSINREKPKSWHGMSNDIQDSQTRPRSIHGSLASDHRLSRQQEVRNLSRYEFSQSPFYREDYQHKRIDTTLKTNDLYHKGKNDETNQYTNLDKKEMCLSRSLSSSFSSNVGSSDEREDSHGIYSAYDVAGRSPYESMLNRRHSQSSLSSSNASWQHSSSSFNYNVRDIPPLLDPPIEKTKESSVYERSAVCQNEYDMHFREEFRLIKENPVKIPPPVAPKPSKFSSSYTIQLHSVAQGTKKETEKKESGFVQNYPPKNQQQTQKADFSKTLSNSTVTSKSVESKVDSKLVSVREIAKKFTPTSVRHISSEINTKTQLEEDARRVKAEHWPKVASIMHQESSPLNKAKDKPPLRPLYPEDRVYGNKGVTMHNKEETHKNSEELASHRLSLQELIKLHEEQIAIQAKSAKTILAHAYIKRSPSDTSAGQSKVQEYNYFEVKDLKTEFPHDLSPATVNQQENQNKLFDDSYTAPKPQVRHPGYEVREVKTDQSSPFKVIELTGKSFENLATGSTKEKTPRIKRHRTIGIVGYRQQIDRTSEEMASTKQKRHTTLGIISDFKEITASKVETSPTMFINDDKVIPTNEYGIERKPDGMQDERIKQEDQKKTIPVKVFDIEASQEQQNQAHMEMSVEHKGTMVVDKTDEEPEEPIALSSSANYWYSSYQQKDLPEAENYIPAISVSPDNYIDTLKTRIPVTEPQQGSSITPTTEEYMRSSHGTIPRNLHSPVVELLPNKKGNPTAHYKAAVHLVSHSASDHRSSKEKEVSSTSNSEQKLTGFDYNLFHQSKPYPVPVAQVSPVNQSDPEIIQAKAIQLASPPPEPPSAHEMYETRLAMWNLLPQQDRSTGELAEHHSNEGLVSFGDKSKESFSSKEQLRSPLYQETEAKDYQDFIESKEKRFSSNFSSQVHTDEYYTRIIERLKDENQRLKEKNEAEKQEFRRMYEEQKKVANAYQKLEDRYRRRVHELQDALANCTCQGSIMVNNVKTPHTKSDKESQSSKTQSIKSGMHIFEELEEWLTEQSKNTKSSKVNATSRDSLISSSSELTGWDDHIDGAIDQVNGTHV